MRFFQRIGSALTRFMYGRNGMDQLNRALFWLYLALWLVETVCAFLLRSRTLTRIFEALLFALMLFIFMRMFSRESEMGQLALARQEPQGTSRR